MTVVALSIVREVDRAFNSALMAVSSAPSVKRTKTFLGSVTDVISENTVSVANINAFVKLVAAVLSAKVFNRDSCNVKSVDRELKLPLMTSELNGTNPASLPMLCRIPLIELLTRVISSLKLVCVTDRDESISKNTLILGHCLKNRHHITYYITSSCILL